MVVPSFAEFVQLAAQGNLVPVYREILADLETPLSAYLKIAGGAGHAFLLESAQGGEKWGRYTILGANPGMIFESKGRRVTIQRTGQPATVIADCNPMQLLKELMARFTPVEVPGVPRFHGGAVGYLGYDMVRFFEKVPDANPDPLDVPDALLMFTDTVVIFDNLLGKLKVVANATIDPNQPLEQTYATARAAIDNVVEALRAPLAAPPAEIEKKGPTVNFQSEMTREQFEQAVLRAKEYIVAGDIMQVVLSHRFSMPFAHSAVELYRALRTTNPSPYLFLIRMGAFSLVGSSPEILVRQEGELATVRPIAGTRRRGATPAEDLALEQELLADPKERAEHLMLLDLGRNDLGRVAVTGSVTVTERFVIERYSHVMHIVSNVQARLQPGLNAFDLVAATFPAGTVTGAPKIRAMEIIDELECSRRGPYAGTVGYFSYSGHMDLAITIRTALLKDGMLHIQAGAGIVADSVPAAEYEETTNKARAVFRAAELALNGLE